MMSIITILIHLRFKIYNKAIIPQLFRYNLKLIKSITMKIILLTIVAFSIGISAFSQNEPSKNLPPMRLLPKVGQVKSIYELPNSTEYKVYNQKGELISEGKGQFIDYTEYTIGTYFVRFEGKSETFEKTK